MPVEQPPKTKEQGGNGTVDTSTDTGTGTNPPASTVLYYAFCLGSRSHEETFTGSDYEFESGAKAECDSHNLDCEARGAHVANRPKV